MVIKPYGLPDVYEIALSPVADHRGHFTRLYDSKKFDELGLVSHWVQENRSFTKRKGTIRGLHLQFESSAETKLIRVTRGAIFDVFVDLRRESPAFGSWGCMTLTESSDKMVYIPKGFAHGFCTLTNNCEVIYKVDNYYCPEREGGIIWNDKTLQISWPVDKPILSEKDKRLPNLTEYMSMN